ncbi:MULTISPECIES: hypothetical protein [unclassified Sporolactobacillus]|uniref:hypothetical protein n=1 Tax=unclassified Sporolactobacillus TaxID=2628533 RepID=UPI0023687D8D|nr:hypothetical protein [Sporolactobacillus sp. CQH2019]MDD9150414.1 hypothetical protein [Sporolactobacillus sp. CQH2019]
MNYRQMITTILTDLHQTERNMDGLHDCGKDKEIDELGNRLFSLKLLAGAMADSSYDALKKHLKGGEKHENA